LYEYYTEYLDEDYDDLTDVDDAEKKPPVVVSTARPADVVESVDKESIPADKSSVFPPSYIFIILASALVSFTVFMLAFLVCRRTVAARRQKKLMPFVVSSSAFGPPSAAVKSSGSIVKSYQRVPTSTKEFLQQQQQHLGSEKKEPLLT
jgi:hypothetical protein